MVNVLNPNWQHERSSPFTLRAARVGAQAGSEHLGATLYDLGRGAWVPPYHAHHNNEELLVVLAGKPTVRQPGGNRQLAAGDVVAFPAGLDGAHRLENHGNEPARALIVSTMRFPDVVEHPDSAKILTAIASPLDGGELLAFRRQDAVHPLEGEPGVDA